jgi:hypothetical protein
MLMIIDDDFDDDDDVDVSQNERKKSFSHISITIFIFVMLKEERNAINTTNANTRCSTPCHRRLSLEFSHSTRCQFHILSNEE